MAEMESQRLEYEKQLQALHAQLHDAVKEAVQVPESPERTAITTDTSLSADALEHKEKFSATTAVSSVPTASTTTGTHSFPVRPRVATDAKSAECNTCIIM